MSSAVPHLIIDRLIRNKQECSSWNLLDSLAGLMISSEKAETGRELAHQACQDTVRIRVWFLLFINIYKDYNMYLFNPRKAIVCRVIYLQYVMSVLRLNWVSMGLFPVQYSLFSLDVSGHPYFVTQNHHGTKTSLKCWEKPSCLEQWQFFMDWL